MMGGLHIEMVALRVLGRWLDGSGWVDALVQAEITTQGRADAMLKAAHVTRARYAHEVSYSINVLLLLFHLMHRIGYGNHTVCSSKRCVFGLHSR